MPFPKSILLIGETVFVVVIDHNGTLNGPSTNIGVFSTREKAQYIIDTSHDPSLHRIETYEIDIQFRRGGTSGSESGNSVSD